MNNDPIMSLEELHQTREYLNFFEISNSLKNLGCFSSGRKAPDPQSMTNIRGRTSAVLLSALRSDTFFSSGTEFFNESKPENGKIWFSDIKRPQSRNRNVLNFTFRINREYFDEGIISSNDEVHFISDTIEKLLLIQACLGSRVIQYLAEDCGINSSYYTYESIRRIAENLQDESIDTNMFKATRLFINSFSIIMAPNKQPSELSQNLSSMGMMVSSRVPNPSGIISHIRSLYENSTFDLTNTFKTHLNNYSPGTFSNIVLGDNDTSVSSLIGISTSDICRGGVKGDFQDHISQMSESPWDNRYTNMSLSDYTSTATNISQSGYLPNGIILRNLSSGSSSGAMKTDNFVKKYYEKVNVPNEELIKRRVSEVSGAWGLGLNRNATIVFLDMLSRSSVQNFYLPINCSEYRDRGLVVFSKNSGDPENLIVCPNLIKFSTEIDVSIPSEIILGRGDAIMDQVSKIKDFIVNQSINQ